MRAKNYLQSMYDINKNTGHYIIQVKVPRYTSIFNDLDNAPIRRRDINRFMQLYLNDCSSDIPFKFGIDISFHILEEERDEKKEQLVKEALRGYYSFSLRLKVNFLKKSYRYVMKYMLAAFGLLLLAFSLESKLNGGVFHSTLLEGINIGGWIFLWEAISLLFFKHKDTRDEIVELRRFLNASVSFTYRTEL